MVCLDTDFLVDLIRKKPRAKEKLGELNAQNKPVSTTPISAAELFEGAYSSNNPEGEVKRVQEIIMMTRLLEINLVACEVYGSLASELTRNGTKIGDMDTLIASIALTHGESLLSNNKKDFEKIPGLTLESY